MYIKSYYDFGDLQRACWSGAIDTLNRIEDEGLEEAFMAYMEEMFWEEAPTLTEINDWLWFDWEMIFEDLGITDEEDEDEEE